MPLTAPEAVKMPVEGSMVPSSPRSRLNDAGTWTVPLPSAMKVTGEVVTIPLAMVTATVGLVGWMTSDVMVVLPESPNGLPPSPTVMSGPPVSATITSGPPSNTELSSPLPHAKRPPATRTTRASAEETSRRCFRKSAGPRMDHAE